MLIISTSSFGCNVFAEDNAVSADTDIEQFIEETTDIIAEYDDDRNYTVSSSGLDFQTCRLIVEQSQDFNPLNSVAVADGYKDFHIVQFENEADTKSAYEYYSRSENVTSIDIDSVVECLDYNPDNSNFDTYDVNNCMSKTIANATNIVKAKQYLLDNVSSFNNIKVAVVDSGIYKEHEALRNRFEGGYDFVDESDEDGSLDEFGHGTEVAGVIVDNTLPNVKLYSYRIVDSSGKTSTLLLINAIQKAIIDKMDIINISLSSERTRNELLEDVLAEADDSGITVVLAAGNHSININEYSIYPARYNSVITVGASSEYKSLMSFTNYGKVVQIYAPGIVVTTNNEGGYSLCIGTSFSAPCVAAECANIKTLYPNEENEHIRYRLVLGGTIKECDYSPLEKISVIDMYKSLVIDKPVIEKTPTPYITIETIDNKQYIKLNCDDKDAVIYYDLTLACDNNYRYAPNIERFSYKVYSEPIEINDSYDIYFFAKSLTKSDSEAIYYPFRLGNCENGFYCNDDGKIMFYVPSQTNADLINMVIPETIDGITVTGFDMSAMLDVFFNDDIESIVMPNTITDIPDNLFNGCTKLKSVIAPSVNSIGNNAFYQCSSLSNIIFDNITNLGENAFWSCVNLSDFPYLEHISYIPNYSFSMTNIKNLYAPECVGVGDYAFQACMNLENVYLPKANSIGDFAFNMTYNLKNVNVDSINGNQCGDYLFSNSGIKNLNIMSEQMNPNWFERCNLDYLYLPNVDSLGNLIGKERFVKRIELEKATEIYIPYKNVEMISIPSCTKTIKKTRPEIVFQGIVFGTEGSYVYDWCINEGVTFKNISQETAIITDLPTEITDADTTLTADVIGFNRTYQWYSNTVADNTTGTAIDGATSKTFVPADYPLANYYYCVVTSKDGDYAPVTITTSVTENKSYTLSDYSAYSAALASAQAIIDNPNYEDKYDIDTRTNFENLLNELILDNSKAYKQAIIDRTITCILEMITELKV